MYINIKWCTGRKTNFTSIYKTTGSKLSVTVRNVGVVTDCAVKMSVLWSAAIQSKPCVSIAGEKQNKTTPAPCGCRHLGKLKITGALRCFVWEGTFLEGVGLCRAALTQPWRVNPTERGTGALCRPSSSSRT